jgi:hypothetical protein
VDREQLTVQPAAEVAQAEGTPGEAGETPEETGTPALSVLNPGFESSGNWSQAGSSAYPGTSFYRSNWGTAQGRTGNGYVISNHAYGYLQSEAIAVTPGQQYDLYSYVRGEVDPDDSEGAWSIRAYFYQSDGSYLTHVIVDAGSTLSTAWTREGGQATVPASAASLRVILYNYMTTGWVAFDDVSLRLVGGGGTNLLADPGFYWGYWGASQPRSGAHAYSISNLAYGYLLSDPIPVSPHTQYDLQAWVRGELDADGAPTPAARVPGEAGVGDAPPAGRCASTPTGRTGARSATSRPGAAARRRTPRPPTRRAAVPSPPRPTRPT